MIRDHYADLQFAARQCFGRAPAPAMPKQVVSPDLHGCSYVAGAAFLRTDSFNHTESN